MERNAVDTAKALYNGGKVYEDLGHDCPYIEWDSLEAFLTGTIACNSNLVVNQDEQGNLVLYIID